MFSYVYNIDISQLDVNKNNMGQLNKNSKPTKKSVPESSRPRKPSLMELRPRPCSGRTGRIPIISDDLKIVDIELDNSSSPAWCLTFKPTLPTPNLNIVSLKNLLKKGLVTLCLLRECLVHYA